MNTVVTFIEPAKVYGSEEDVPGAIGEWFESDWELLKNVRDVDPSGVPPYASVFGDAPDFEMSWVLDGFEVFRVRSR